MAPGRRAIIDVGTNSVKLLVAEVDGQLVTPVVEHSEQTRLGRGFYVEHRLQADAIAQTAQAVSAFARIAASHAAPARVIATSAARDAVNQGELLDAIRAASGLPVEIISGEQEADWAFRGVTSDPKLHGQPLLILDVGGGSTEFILGEHGHFTFRQSFDLGSVRLLEKLHPGDPPTLHDIANCREWLQDFLHREIGPALENFLRDEAHRETKLVGTGGTATILARMVLRTEAFDRERIEATRLNHQQVLEYLVHLWSLSLADRRQIPGLPANRADVILMGVAISEVVMRHFRLDDLRVSTRGLRFGAVMDG